MLQLIFCLHYLNIKSRYFQLLNTVQRRLDVNKIIIKFINQAFDYKWETYKNSKYKQYLYNNLIRF